MVWGGLKAKVGMKAGAQAGGEPVSFIGPEVTVTGDIRSAGHLQIDGTVTGDVRCATLTQGPGGSVRGNIAADEVRLAGLVDGAVEAGAVSLEASARVTGDVLYEALGIAPGAEVEGRFRRRRGGETAAGKAGPGEAVAARVGGRIASAAAGDDAGAAAVAAADGDGGAARGDRPGAVRPARGRAAKAGGLFAAADPAPAAEAAE